MKHYNNVLSNRISWLNVKDFNHKWGGVISDLYYPESIDELIDICRQCQRLHRDYYVFGHTSNSYFLPTFSPDVVISVLYLRNFCEVGRNTITVECGMHSKVLARMMVDNGFQGFEGLVDLPGTISGAIYGNAGCYGCLISDELISVKLLLPSGDIVDYTKDELGFNHRSSHLKNGVIKGVILTACFHKIKGDIEELAMRAKHAHEDRLRTQPGPANNLGSIFLDEDLNTYGHFVRRIGKFTAKVLHISESSHFILNLKLFLSGFPGLGKYLYGMNRFIWKDPGSIKAFERFLRLRGRLYTNTNLEIEIFK